MTRIEHIYFLKPIGFAGPIKIGCSGWPDQRISQLMTWSPFPLELIYSFPGDQKLEHRIHRCFADFHSHAEWFHPGPRLVGSIQALKDGKPFDVAIDFSVDNGSIRGGKLGKRDVVPEMVGFRSYTSRLRHAQRRAGDAAKEHRVAPDDVRDIISKWEGLQGYRIPRNPVRPTEEEFARLSEVIADPYTHCIRPDWLIKKVAA